MNCINCNKRKLDEQGHEELERFIAADKSFDAGEFSGAHDYYYDICTCCPHGVDNRVQPCGKCILDERFAWEEEMYSSMAVTEGPQLFPTPSNGEL